LTIPLAIFLLAGVGSSTIASEPSDRTLREEADRETERLSRIAKIHDEPALDSYLAAMVSRLMAGSPLSDAPPIRVTVLRDVAPSAFMLPNARLFVHTGLLARLGNEAQLAAILARETVHLTAGHALRVDRDAPDTSGQPVSSPLPAQGLPLTYTAAVTGYGRDLEREADAGGLTRVARAGYDPREALLAFERLREEYARGAVARDPLLVPEVIALPAAHAAALAERGEVLAAAGLEGEPFGDGTFLLRTVPRLLRGRDAGAVVCAVARELAEEGASAAAERAADAALATLACHSVVRVGERLDPAEVRALLAAMDGVDVAAHCPHGRPVAVTLERARVEALFKR